MTNTAPTSAAGAPDVSVIMPAWNAAGFIGTSIDSILESEGASFEIVIVDDASDDDTFAVLQRRAQQDPRVRIDRLDHNGGPSAARNRAIELSSGRYIAVVDADDTIAISRLKKLVSLADTSGADIVVDNMLEVDEDGEQLGGSFLKSARFQSPHDVSLAEYVRYNQPMAAGDCLGYLKPLFRRATLHRLNARYDEALRNSEDYYLVADLLAQGALMTYTPYTGYFYRRAAGSTSHRLKPAHTAAWLIAERNFQTRHDNGETDTFDDSVRRHLKQRERRLQDTDQMVRAIDAIKARRFASFIEMLVADPRASLFTLNRFVRIAWQRLARPASARAQS